MSLTYEQVRARHNADTLLNLCRIAAQLAKRKREAKPGREKDAVAIAQHTFCTQVETELRALDLL